MTVIFRIKKQMYSLKSGDTKKADISIGFLRFIKSAYFLSLSSFLIKSTTIGVAINTEE